MTQADLFRAPAPSVPSAEGWHELTHTNGRHYRWRIHLDRLDGHPVGEKAPAQHRWELEFQRAGDWLEVRNYNRRDAIWAAVREEAMRDA